MIIAFKLLKPLNGYKVGKKFDHFGGLVSGVEGVSFCDETYFKPIYDKRTS